MIALLGGLSLLAGPQISARLFGDDGVARYYSPLVRAFDLLRRRPCRNLRAKQARLSQKWRIVRLSGPHAACCFLPCNRFVKALALLADTLAGWRHCAAHLGRAAQFHKQALVCQSAGRFVGLISYELYLWHWPLLSFANILAGGQGHVAGLAKAALLLPQSPWPFFSFIIMACQSAENTGKAK